MATKNRPIHVTRLPRANGSRSRARSRQRGKTDPDRENRIIMEVVVDAYDGPERAMGWFGYLESQLEFPFTAHCTDKRAISPLLAGDEVEVISMAPADECESEMFVMIRWEHGGLGVPLSQLRPIHASDATAVAVADWRYWVEQGYRF